MSYSYQNHQNLVNKTKLKFSSVFRSCGRMFDRHVGMFYKRRVEKGTVDYIPIKINRPGQADNWAVIKCFHYTDKEKRFPIPFHVEVESKTGKGKLREEQKEWKKNCELLGVPFFENRDEIETIKQIVNEINSRGLIVHEVHWN